MASRLLDMVAERVTYSGGVYVLGGAVVRNYARFLTFEESAVIGGAGAAVDGADYDIHIENGAGWSRAAMTWNRTAGTLTPSGPWLTVRRSDAAPSTDAPDLTTGIATATVVLSAGSQATNATLQDTIDDITGDVAASAASATAAGVSAAAAAASAAAADPSGRVLRAGDTMTGPLNLKRATVASHAATADIWAAGNEIDWTGTATTTDFHDAPYAGASRRLFCAGTCTFTNNANIAVQGGANFTAAAGDIVTIDAITEATFRATIERASGLAVAPTPNTPNVVQIATSTVSGTPATVDIGFTGYFKLYLLLEGVSHNNGASRAIGLAFGTGGTGGSFGTPIDMTSSIVAAGTATVTIEFTVSASTAQPITYATIGATGLETAVPAGANALRIGPTSAGPAFSGNLDAGTVTLIGMKLG